MFITQNHYEANQCVRESDRIEINDQELSRYAKSATLRYTGAATNSEGKDRHGAPQVR
jgi:hypothetical protein